MHFPWHYHVKRYGPEFGIVILFLIHLEASRFGFWEITGAPRTITLGTAAVIRFLYCCFGNVCIDFCQRLDEIFFLFNCLCCLQILGKSQRTQSQVLHPVSAVSPVFRSIPIQAYAVALPKRFSCIRYYK